MNQTQPIPDDWRTDHLFVLVGGNPLPNYVAAQLLLKEGGFLHLIHSQDTEKIARKLAEPYNNCCTHEIADSVDPGAIQSVMRRALANCCQEGTIGLHYTGGTKAMSVHAYQAVKELKEEHPNTIFTYLNARDLTLRRDGETAKPVQYELPSPLSIATLLELHGINLKRPPITEFLYPELNQALAEAHKTKEGQQAYAQWCSRYLRNNHVISAAKEANEQIIDRIFQLKDELTGDNLYQQVLMELRASSLCSGGLVTDTAHLPQEPIPLPKHPKLEPVAAIMRDRFEIENDGLRLQATVDRITQEEPAAGITKVKHLISYLDGMWVEHLTLNAFRQNVDEYGCDLDDIMMSLDTDQKNTQYNFEFDVAAMQGYQLYAVSCTRDNTASRCKSKLFEAYIRARQLGGDEARVALVCAYDKPGTLQDEVTEYWGTDRKQIRVFGASHLPKLKNAIYGWLSE